ncbi:hypothetical protein [Clostridium tyrobutyricum]|uniref:hypothetical protein n=1 Tax=Clostridium tyrobutyricum TaxID=1519 RepID=UPI0013634BD6|nr:hypothetical protein [Clostridium tyrobutyricum]
MLVLTILAEVLGAFLANPISSGTLIAFINVSIAIYKLRSREGVDIPMPKFKITLYPIIAIFLSCTIFWGLNTETKILILI